MSTHAKIYKNLNLQCYFQPHHFPFLASKLNTQLFVDLSKTLVLNK